MPDDDKKLWYVDSNTEQHKPLIRTTITLIFPNLGSETINEHIANFVAEAMDCGARETYVTITPEDEDDD